MDAMKNSLILDNIFARLGTKEQKEFRLVNRTWNDATTNNWRRSAIVSINTSTKTETKQDKNGPHQFLKLWKSGKYESHQMKDVPFRRFKICLKDSENVICVRDLPQLWDFWKLCSPKMEYLQIDFHGLSGNVNDVRNTIKWLLLERCEKLKELVITVNCTDLFYIPYSWLLGDDMYNSASASATAHHLIALTLKCKASGQGSTIVYSDWPEIDESYKDQAGFLKNLQHVSNWTKNLKKLSLVLDNDTLCRICQLWPELKELTLLEHSTVTEAGIEQAKRINNALNIIRE